MIETKQEIGEQTCLSPCLSASWVQRALSRLSPFPPVWYTVRDMFPPGTGKRDRFLTTSWSLVLKASQPATATANKALEDLCRTYWYPVYAFVRRRGFDAEDAKDLTQSFFCRLLEHNYLADADSSRGRFRSFLLTAVRNYLANEWDRQHALKRGGNSIQISLDTASAEGRYSLLKATSLDPETSYAKEWALELLEQVSGCMRSEYEKAGKLGQFEKLSPFLTGGEEQPYATLATVLDTTEGAARVALHRARKKYREVLRKRIAETVSTEEEIDDEIRFLLIAIGSSQ